MSAGRADITRLRREFDESFARPSEQDAPDTVDVLRGRAGGRLVAMPIDDVAEVERARDVAPVASAADDVVGIAIHRGAVVSVHDLGAHLSGARCGAPDGWLVRPRDKGSAVFHMDDLLGLATVPRTRLDVDPSGDVFAHARIEDELHLIVRLRELAQRLPRGDR